MKKTLCILLSLLLVCLCAFSFAEESEADPYEAGALEMYRQIMLRDYTHARSLTPRETEPDPSEIDCVVIPSPPSSANYPNGILLNRDDNCVVLMSDERAVTFFCTELENAVDITAGFLILQANYCSGSVIPDLWEIKDYKIRQLELDDCSAGISGYQLLADNDAMLAWASLKQYDTVEHNIMGRVEALFMNRTAIDNALVYDQLFFENVPDAVIINHKIHVINVQTKDKTYVFPYAEGYDEPAAKWMIFNVMMGGTELWDLHVYDLWADDDTEHTSGWQSYEEMQATFDAFMDDFFVVGVEKIR